MERLEHDGMTFLRVRKRQFEPEIFTFHFEFSWIGQLPVIFGLYI